MTSNLLNILLQAQPGGGGGALMPVLLVGMIVVMYFFMIRPQQKRAKEQKKFSESVGVGDRVITTSGIHGRITRTNEDGRTLTIQIDKNTNVIMERSAISMELSKGLKEAAGTNEVAAITAK